MFVGEGQGLTNDNRLTESIWDRQGQPGGFEPGWVESKVKAGKVDHVERGAAGRETPSFVHAKDRFGLLFNLAWGWPVSIDGEAIPLCGND